MKPRKLRSLSIDMSDTKTVSNESIMKEGTHEQCYEAIEGTKDFLVLIGFCIKDVAINFYCIRM